MMMFTVFLALSVKAPSQGQIRVAKNILGLVLTLHLASGGNNVTINRVLMITIHFIRLFLCRLLPTLAQR